MKTANSISPGQITEYLDEAKAVDIQTLDVRGMTSITDYMVIATGTSNRHVKAIGQKIIDEMKPLGIVGIEGMELAEWVLIDLGDIVVHLMQQSVRDFYQLEQLWGMDTAAGHNSE